MVDPVTWGVVGVGAAATLRLVDACAEWIAGRGRRALFGGAQPSTLVGRAQWLVYADWRAAATPQTAQTAGLAAAAVAEALKFIPDGADRVPDAVLDRFDPTGRDPETLTRSALQTCLDRHLHELAALKEQEDSHRKSSPPR